LVHWLTHFLVTTDRFHENFVSQVRVDMSELKYQTTDSGLAVGMPVKDTQAWNNGLIVTPYFNPHLALRGRDVRDGFRINGTAPQTQGRRVK
jgi:hypothetical protein